MTWDRVERLIGTDNLKRLAEAHVCVVGLGSGGGFVAQSLAMSGVGQFTLIDDDVLEAANVVRHVCDLRDVGRNKAEAVGDLLRHRNPDVKVDVRKGRVEQHMDALDACDVLVVAVDGEGVKYAINEACLERDLVAIYAGVYERGEGGDVVMIRPYQGPCYACWSAELREGLFQPDASEDLDYGMIGPEGTLEAEPGLWLHVVKVATVQADMALEELLHDDNDDKPWPYPGNTLIMANEPMEIIDGQLSPPHTSLWANIQRDPYCMVCGDQVNDDENQDESAFTLDDLAGQSGITIEGEESASSG